MGGTPSRRLAGFIRRPHSPKAAFVTRRTSLARALATAAAFAGCGPPAIPSLPPDSFAFGVFGDGPYYRWEQGRFDRVLADVRNADVGWLLHVGDILWTPCSDEAFEERRRDFQSVGHPVIYTPGDNEWTDCHDPRAGGYAPLDRLASLRRIFFSDPVRSLGNPSMSVASQASDSAFAEFPENGLWRRGGFVFATIHIVGSGNGLESFPQRSAADDAEVEQRTRAAIEWLDHAFASARTEGAKGIVLAMHADPHFEGAHEPGGPWTGLIARLREKVAGFAGPVLLIHGDSHIQRVDQPLTDATGATLANFTRLETFGSPDIGWIRVVVDTVAGRITAFEPRRFRGWW